ncbi:hypothetical protein DH2020_003192 [Rehmannia glutinosa]|uniref:Homeobox protein knotted-1-like 1 n=1 Tax=Rehmannia glutinosa TaxID=99300 RepID=A0ABR0XLD4_REHGL
MVLTAPPPQVSENPDHQMGTGMEMSDIIKAQIANHPFYPTLLSAYIDCRKVGAPPEMASLLEEISKENVPISSCSQIGTDPELDDFMVLQKYKEELSKPFDEATNFLSSIESQLTDLCKQTLPSTTTYSYHSADEAGGGPSDDDMYCGEVEAAISGISQESSGNNNGGDQELKEMLMRKYSGYLSSLRKEFLKKRKKGKLPKDAITALLEWWNTHYRWPYPTEEEKNRLSEITGLDQKQINNWFINQRKRHWRPSEDMRFALMEGVSSGANPGSMYFDNATGGT